MKLLYPFALLYGIIIGIRNLLFDFNLLKQEQFGIPIISIGNLNMGGSGKTPHVEYFINYYKEKYNIAVISRGYGRKTKGFRYVNSSDLAELCGDEPLQIKRKFEHIVMAVGEKRVDAIRKITLEHPKINLILLDDAFQHRFVKPSVSILLTDYSKPFWKDSIAPAGKLREFSFGYKRATAIIITKCPQNPNLSIPKNINSKPIYYSHINYQAPVLVHGALSKNIILITGIANPNPLLSYLNEKGYTIRHHFKFSDHHQFNNSDSLNIVKKMNETLECMVLTTEKDYMRVVPSLKNKLPNLAYMPIHVAIKDAPVDWLTL